MQTRIDTTFTGKNISSAASVYEYTAPAAGMYTFQVRLAAVAGNGDYIAYLTLNDGDAQSDDIMEPRTTATLDSGQTTCWFQTMKIPLLAGDVVNVVLTGQGGDTSEAGSIRIFSENYAVAGDEMDLVDAPNATAITAIQSGLATDGGEMDLIDDAITSAKFDESSAFPVKSADSGSTQIARVGADSDTLETLSDQIDAIETTASVAVSASEAAALADNEIALTKYHTLSQAVTSTSTNDLDSATKVWFAIKETPYNTDAESLIYIEQTDNLSIVNGSTSGVTAAQGTLTVSGSSGDWTITVYIASEVTGALATNNNYVYEIKYTLDDKEYQYDAGTCYVYDGTIREIG